MIPSIFLGSFEHFLSINLKLIILILIFLGLVTQVFFLDFSLVLMVFVRSDSTRADAISFLGQIWILRLLFHRFPLVDL